MIIPKSFDIAGKTYKVKFDTKRMLKQHLIGQCNYAQCEIFLSQKDHKSIQCVNDIEHTFLHEVWHTIWDALGETKLKKDEQKADAFCSLLHQMLNSRKGKLL